jgi:IS30 family transposase
MSGRVTAKKVRDYGPTGVKRWRRVTPAMRSKMIRLAAKGVSREQIAVMVGHGGSTVSLCLAPLGGVFQSGTWTPAPGRLTLEDRCEIRIALERRATFTAIAGQLGRSVSTVSREVNANGGRDDYRPTTAHQRAFDHSRRPKRSKLAEHPRLCAQVVAWLQMLLSPEQIAGRLQLHFPDAPDMRVSYETIYKTLYVLGRGELKRELTACLRTGRAHRKTRGRTPTTGAIVDKVMISLRPADVEDRALAGHWEGDLIMGQLNSSAIGTLVERTTRYVQLLYLPNGHTAEAVRVAMTAKIKVLPEAMMRTITWDQGSEMAQHAQFKIDTDIQIYFCDPHSPWQRGTNENTNGLLRQYLPKGTDLSIHGPVELAAIEDSLNSRPRKTLGFRTPAEAFAELVATTA